MTPYQRISPRMRQVLAYIDLHYGRDIELSEVASLVSIHPDYLSKRFKKEVGIRFHHYLVWNRIQRASCLLIHSTKSVKEISYEVGFRRPEIFSKAFKRLIGYSPMAYRTLNLSVSVDLDVEVAPSTSSYPAFALAQPGTPSNQTLPTILEIEK